MTTAVTTALFIVLCLGHGALLALLRSLPDSRFERLLLQVGFGLAMLPVVGVLLDLLHVPLRPWAFLLTAALCVAVALRFGYHGVAGVWPLQAPARARAGEVAASVGDALLVSLLFAAILAMFLTGAFAYSWMEDGDPWLYTAVAKVIAEEGTFRAPFRYNHYSEPYTQGYQIVLAVLHQANHSIHWTVKAFNSVFAALAVPFGWLFAREALREVPGGRGAALAAALALFAVPAWMTHFIFSLTLNMALLPLCLYTVLRAARDRAWAWPAGVVLGSIVLNHFFTAFVTVGLVLAFIAIHALREGLQTGRWLRLLGVSALVALAFYLPAAVLRHGYYSDAPTLESHGGAEMVLAWAGAHAGALWLLAGAAVLAAIAGLLAARQPTVAEWLAHPRRFEWGVGVATLAVLAVQLLPPEPIVRVPGCCSREYSLADFLFPQVHNLINNTIGWGVAYSVLTATGVLFALRAVFLRREGGLGLAATLLLFALTFMLVHGMQLAFGLMTYRMWSFMTLFSSLLAGYGLARLGPVLCPRIGRTAASGVIAVAVFGLLADSFVVKWRINTMPWPDHEILVEESHAFHAQLRERLPPDTPVVSLCRHSDYLIAYDLLPPLLDRRITPPWRAAHEPVLFEEAPTLSDRAIADRLIEAGVTHAVAGFGCMQEESQRPAIVALVKRLLASRDFAVVHRSSTDVLVKPLAPSAVREAAAAAARLDAFGGQGRQRLSAEAGEADARANH